METYRPYNHEQQANQSLENRYSKCRTQPLNRNEVETTDNDIRATPSSVHERNKLKSKTLCPDLIEHKYYVINDHHFSTSIIVA